MSVQAAFYIDGTSLADRLIRWRTQSDTSHVELVIDGYKYSSYPGIGVRKDIFVPSVGKWRVVNLPAVKDQQILDFFNKTKGDAYDWLAVTLGQSFYVKLDNPSRYFCSEWCAVALGFPEGWRFTPALLEIILKNTDLAIE